MLKLSKTRWMAAVLVLGALLPAKGFAWNFVGHEVVARIAWDQLTPIARQQIKALIRQHPALDADLLKEMPADFGDRDLYAFIVSAAWPDIIRSETNPWHAKYHHAGWHYINVPYVLDGTDRSKLRDADPGPTDWQTGTNPTDLVQALKKCEYDLRDPNLSGPEKAIALSWYLHLAGDAHQPLHANTLFSDRFPAGDKGGNSSVVRAPVETTQPTLISPQEYFTPPGQDLMRGTAPAASAPSTDPAAPPLVPVNLHFYWDNIFGRLGPARVLDALQNEITTEYPPAALQKITVNLQYTAWADESFDYAVHDAHGNGTLATGTADDLKNPSHPLIPTLPDDYLPRAQEVSRLRMATAGYRIANVLNDIFAAK